MKPKTIRFAPPLVALALLLAAGSPALGYQISLSWLGGVDPVVFSVGAFIPGDISHPSDIHFDQIPPFVQVDVNNSPGGTDPANLYLWIRMEAGDGSVVFSVHSRQMVNVPDALVSGSPHNNQQLAMNPTTDMVGFRGQDVMPFLDGGNIKQGFYTVTVALTDADTWGTGHTYGIGTLGLVVQNPSQVRLELPDDNTTISTNPVLIWSFPRQVGVTFVLEVVKGNPGDDPWTTVEFANPSNVYAQVTEEVPDWLSGGVMTAYIYTGTGAERPLDPGTYFWRVTANAPGVFPGDNHAIPSQAFTFTYNPSQGGQGHGGGTGWLPGEAGGSEYNPPPLPPDLFQLLKQLLPDALYQQLLAQLGSLDGWAIGPIKIGDREVTLQELANFLLSGNRTIAMVAVSQ